MWVMGGEGGERKKKNYLQYTVNKEDKAEREQNWT